MNLIVDIGNTLTKIAIVENDNVVFSNRYEKFTKENLIEALSTYSPEKGIVCAVGTKDMVVVDYLRKQIPTIDLDFQSKLPITILYKTPETLGLDRIAATVGANFLYPESDLLVIDFGTAITYDLINQKREYFGGAISPGIMLRYKSLHQNTAHLPLISSIQNTPVIGTNTHECIGSGVLNGVIGEVDFFIGSIKVQYPNLKVIVTGGDSNFFVSKLKNSIFVVQNLVIIGLNRILDFNVQL
jgi:type III pantothenate kinase